MPSIYELVDAKPIAAYYEEAATNNVPYLGAGLFPAKKKVGLNLEWIVGYSSAPIALMPSAFDTKPTVRNRLKAKSINTEMPFFRESMRVGEKDRQMLLMLMENSNNAYVMEIITRIFDDIKNLVDGAEVQCERMRMSLLATGGIDISAPNESGVVVNYSYNYDPQGTWATENNIELTLADRWSETTANPISDILDIKRMAAAKGVTLTRAILSLKTWTYLMNNASIKDDMNVQNGQKIILTDSMLQQYLLSKTGVVFSVYNKVYKNESGVDAQFYPDNYVTFLPAGTVGNTYFGTTPEEADLMSGAANANVSIVNTGVAVTTIKEASPVNVVTVVSEITLPSFEGMNSVFVLKVAGE